MNFADLLSAYSEHLKIRNYAPSSIGHYTQHLHGFFAWLTENTIRDVKKITRGLLTDWQATITARPDYAAATVAMKVRAVKRFFAYLEETNHILINPAEYLKEPKKETRLPRTVLTDREVRKILEQPNLSTLTGIRDRTILEVFYSTGLRLEELIALTIYDADLQGGLLRVNKGKGAKDRVIPLGKHASAFLKEYSSRVRPRLTSNNKPSRTLFVNRAGHPVSRQVIELMVRTCAHKAGSAKKVTPHVFRHSFATALVRNGADITAVQKMLGHATLKVTQLYTKVAGVEVKKTHAASHPREKDKADDATPRIKRIRGPRDRSR